MVSALDGEGWLRGWLARPHSLTKPDTTAEWLSLVHSRRKRVFVCCSLSVCVLDSCFGFACLGFCRFGFVFQSLGLCFGLCFVGLADKTGFQGLCRTFLEIGRAGGKPVESLNTSKIPRSATILQLFRNYSAYILQLFRNVADGWAARAPASSAQTGARAARCWRIVGSHRGVVAVPRSAVDRRPLR